MARPTASSFWYAEAVSTSRYPASSASMTLRSHSSASGIWKTPNPRMGISTPLFSTAYCIVAS